jgi:hypothetical protein
MHLSCSSNEKALSSTLRIPDKTTVHHPSIYQIVNDISSLNFERSPWDAGNATIHGGKPSVRTRPGYQVGKVDREARARRSSLRGPGQDERNYDAIDQYFTFEIGRKQVLTYPAAWSRSRLALQLYN